MIKQQLYDIIKNGQIKTVFQPIISLRDGSILGHEALSRVACECDISNPEVLFEAAVLHECIVELESLCRIKAFEAAFKFLKPPYNKKLFINVNPNIVYDKEFRSGFTREHLERYNIKPSNIIFEITERNCITDFKAFISTIEHYKSQNYEIAIDDAGAGYSGLNLISDIHPHYIKLDMKLVRNVNADSLKYALIKCMVELARITNIRIIAEGIETEQELSTLIHLGVHYGQGYYIQKPNESIIEIRNDLLNLIYEENRKKNHIYGYQLSDIYVENITVAAETVSPLMHVETIYNMLKEDENKLGYCVVENDFPVGIITRDKLIMQLSGRYGFTLNQSKPAYVLMDKNFLSVDCRTPINVVSSLAMSRQNESLYDFVVVTKNEKYFGITTVKDLLRKATEVEIEIAKQKNPLSGLPGNVMIEYQLSQCISKNDKYCVAYIDIDNFKPYNDKYGFENGDKIILLLANILKDNFSENEFIGHIGGDDFVVILNRNCESGYFDNIIEQFNTQVLEYYNEEDVLNGYIISKNRQGLKEKFSIITVTVVFLNSSEERFSSIFDISKELANRKKLEKSKRKSRFIASC
ncbi:MAG: GGDEF domain-containing protein [Clostridia bacterium]|nr:GGDEF domain-containing protein [Clostridia bacterium]